MDWQEQNKLIQGFFRDFDKLWFEQNKGELLVGQRFVKVGEKMQSEEEYVQERLSGSLPFKKCGEGDNVCNCKNANECGYL